MTGSDANSAKLFLAIKNGTLSEIKALIELGTDMNAKDSSGYTVLQRAIQYNQIDLVLYLLEQKASLQGVDILKLMALYRNCNQQQAQQLIRQLRTYGTPPTDLWINQPYTADANRTALIKAVVENRLNEVKALVELGADLSILDAFNKNALYYAMALKQTDIILLLQNHGAKPVPEIKTDTPPILTHTVVSHHTIPQAKVPEQPVVAHHIPPSPGESLYQLLNSLQNDKQTIKQLAKQLDAKEQLINYFKTLSDSMRKIALEASLTPGTNFYQFFSTQRGLRSTRLTAGSFMILKKMQQENSAQKSFEKVVDRVEVTAEPLPASPIDDKVTYYAASAEDVQNLPKAKAVIVRGSGFFEQRHQQSTDDLDTSEDDENSPKSSQQKNGLKR